jgi:hypothetical protein
VTRIPSHPFSYVGQGRKDAKVIRRRPKFTEDGDFLQKLTKATKVLTGRFGLAMVELIRVTAAVVRQTPVRINIRHKPWSVPRLRGRGEQG